MATVDYQRFLDSKQLLAPSCGFELAPEKLNPLLFKHQKVIVSWALRKGRAAIFAMTGLGKTLMQLEWLKQVTDHEQGRGIIFAPLALVQQTIEEGEKFGYKVHYVRSGDDVATYPETERLFITNYDILHRFSPKVFIAGVLDESSILKNFAGETRKALEQFFVTNKIPYRLCCTATPAPNAYAEITNHATFLSVMSNRDILTIFFTTKKKKKDKSTQRFRLKKHAVEAFYQWLASWAMPLTKPSDLGSEYSDEGYNLPPLTIKPIVVDSNFVQPGQMFPTELKGVTDRAAARKASLPNRVAATVGIVTSEPDEQWIVWTDLNDESTALAKAIPGAVEVTGDMEPEVKAELLGKFAKGLIKVLVTKPSIAAFGLNYQSCARTVFCGLGDSYEKYFQAIRRLWRFGQLREVLVYIVLSEVEQTIYANVLRKEKEAEEMYAALVKYTSLYSKAEIKGITDKGDYNPSQPMQIPHWLRSVA